MATTRRIEEQVVEGKPLGRHVEHDEASRAFAATRAPALVTTAHKRRHKPFDQGSIGDCTGMAITGCLDTLPFKHRFLTERTALKLYRYATTVDDFLGEYPPEDTGSSGLAACKAAQHYGFIDSYHHAFGLQHALEALVLTPVITGIPWYSSFDEPASDGLIEISPDADVRGGHEVEVVGLDIENQRIRFCNSWSREWGDRGYAEMTWATFERLLDEDGDVTVPVPKVT